MDYEYFLKRNKLIAIDLSKQFELENSDLKEQINFTGRLERKSEEKTFEFSQNSEMKFANLPGNAGNESSKFATRKWYVINDQNNRDYGDVNENDATIKFETKVIKSNLCDYSGAYILVTGDVTATGGDANTKLHLKIVLYLQIV